MHRTNCSMRLRAVGRVACACMLLGVAPHSIAQPAGDAQPAWAQRDSLEGYWRGAYQRQGSVLPTELRIERGEDGVLRASQQFPDWIYYGWLDPEPVTVAKGEDGRPTRVSFDGLYGTAELVLDGDYREMIGSVASSHPPVTLHVKRAIAPPEIRVEERSMVVRSDVPLAATLVLPEGDGPHACIVHLHGRGCRPRLAQLWRARELARYGVASLVFDARGSSADGVDCETTTLETVTADALSAYRLALDSPRIDASRTGFLGTSAGAWTAQAATELAKADPATPNPAFIITWIGPSTSIEAQQRDAGEAIGRSLGLGDVDIELVMRQMELAMDREREPEALFDEFEQIRETAEQGGWLESMFGPDDFPKTAEELDRVWLRRFRYDPTDMLRQLDDVPYLAVFGEEDDVVPVDLNAPRLEQLLDDAGNTDYRIVIIPGQGHSVEHGDMARTLSAPGPDVMYWKFDRVEPRFMESTIEFLRERGFATR